MGEELAKLGKACSSLRTDLIYVEKKSEEEGSSTRLVYINSRDMSHAALSRLNSRHNFTSPDAGLHQEGAHSSPFAKSKTAVKYSPKGTIEWASVEPSLRNEVAKKELASKLKSRQSSMPTSKQIDDASVVSKASGVDADDDDKVAEEEEEDYGDVYDWRFDGTAEGDRENDRNLGVGSGEERKQYQQQPSQSIPTARQGLSSSYGSGYSLTSLASSFSSSNSPAGSGSKSFQKRSLQTARSLQKMTMSAASSLAQAVTAFGEPEPETLIARSESFMKLHSLKAPQSPINNRRRENDQDVEGSAQEAKRESVSIVSAIDAVMGTLGTKKSISQVPPKKLQEDVTREDVFPKNAHAITFAPKQPAPPEGEYRTLFDVQAARSFRLEKKNLPVSRSHGKLAPLHNSQQPPMLPPDIAPRPSPELRSLMGRGGIMRPPPLNLNITAGGSAVRGQSLHDLTQATRLVAPPLMSPIASNSKGGRGTPKHEGDASSSSASPSGASSSFLSQALKKTSSYLSMPLPVLALQPEIQQDVFVLPDEQKSESVDSFLKTAVSFLGLQTSPVVAKSKSKTGLLSERHKKVIADASPGVGTPVIYVPHTARSEASEVASIYSNVTGATGLLEVGSPKANRFQPASLRHLDLSQVAEASLEQTRVSGKPPLEVSDVGSDNPIKQLDATWAACWDDEAGAVYYYNQNTGEATWLPPRLDDATEDEPDEDFFHLLNNGLPRGLSEFKMGDSELTLKTRKIAARHKLWSKLRNRYEGDTTEFTSALEEKEKSHYGKLEDSEVLWEYQKEVADWLID